MEELRRITDKYNVTYVRDNTSSLEDINRFALVFYKDVAEIYDTLTRIRHVDRNPAGFSLDDAPILGLLIRVWKLLKGIVRYYEEDNGEFISLLERPLLEAAVIASYLLGSDLDVIEDYRKCSYKDRLRILRDLESGSVFFETKAGQRMLQSVRAKMSLEALAPQDFAAQKKNSWRVQGKSFHKIFAEVIHEDLYACTYGMMSESIHGSWQESVDWSLLRNADGTFSTFPFHHPPDVRYVTPLLRFTNEPFRLWLQRIDCYDQNNHNVLDWIERINAIIYEAFDEKYSGEIA